MTAFGRYSIQTPFGRFVAEIKSVNRKFLDINISTQKGLSCFEADIRTWISSQIYRGKVDVYVWATFEGTNPVKITPNLTLASELKNAWEQIAAKLDVITPFNLEMLQNEPGILIYEENIDNADTYLKIIKETIESALKAVMKMKAEEGSALQKDIESRLQKLSELMQRIEKIGDASVQKYRDKLIQRMKDFIEATEIDDRILKEIALYSEKIDISEEITRFHSHIKQFLQYIHSNSEGIGKTLEFLVQELLREANTIGSKCQDVEVSRITVEIKSEIERIREQIQNVE